MPNGQYGVIEWGSMMGAGEGMPSAQAELAEVVFACSLLDLSMLIQAHDLGQAISVCKATVV